MYFCLYISVLLAVSLKSLSGIRTGRGTDTLAIRSGKSFLIGDEIIKPVSSPFFCLGFSRPVLFRLFRPAVETSPTEFGLLVGCDSAAAGPRWLLPFEPVAQRGKVRILSVALRAVFAAWFLLS